MNLMSIDNRSDSSPPAKFELRFSSLVTVIFLAFAAIGIAYVAGVMTGRHGSAAGEAAPRGAAVSPAPVEEGKEERVLSAEELEYARVLRGVTAAPAKPEEPAAETPPPAEEKPQEPDERPAPPDNNIYDYVFQMGAFRDETMADNLRQELEGAGFRTILEKSGKMLVVLIRLRGDGHRADEVMMLAEKLRLGKPIVRSRKIVSP